MKNKKDKEDALKGRFAFLNAMFLKERRYIAFLGACFLVAGITYPYPQIAMWVGFAFAAYSAVANDSIQTIGTFIASSGNQKWWALWLFIGGIFLLVVGYSWWIYSGDVSFQRLASKGFAESPQSFHFLQIAAPIFLLIITRLRMPVSTTFLLLSSFTTSAGAITGIFQKSITGYFLAFFLAIAFWFLFSDKLRKAFKGKPKPYWTVFQWITSGSLWALWIMQDAANIAVFLPRQLNIFEFLAFSMTVFLGLGILFYLRGDKIQKIVDEKTDVVDVRPATVIDLFYTMILIVFTWINTVPMSTTWVFLGLLGGRELGMSLNSGKHGSSLKSAWRMIIKDASLAIIGLFISIVIAVAVNPVLQEWFFGLFTGGE